MVTTEKTNVTGQVLTYECNAGHIFTVDKVAVNTPVPTTTTTTTTTTTSTTSTTTTSTTTTTTTVSTCDGNWADNKRLNHKCRPGNTKLTDSNYGTLKTCCDYCEAQHPGIIDGVYVKKGQECNCIDFENGDSQCDKNAEDSNNHKVSFYPCT